MSRSAVLGLALAALALLLRRPGGDRSRAARRPEGAVDRTGRDERPGHRHRRGRVQSRRPLRRRRHGRRLEVDQRRPHLDADLRRPAGRLDRRHRRLPGESGRRLGGHRRGQPAQQRLGRQRRLPLARRRQDLEPPGAREDRAHRPASCSIPPNPGRRLGGGPRPGVGGEPGARRLQDRGRRQDLDARCSTSTSAPAPPTWRSIPANPDKLLRRACGSSGAGPGSSTPAAPAPASTSPTTAARPGSGAPRRTACPRATSGGSARHLALATRRSSTPWSRPRRAPAALGRRRPQLEDGQRQRPTLDPRPFYFADLAVDPQLAEPRLQPGHVDSQVSDDGGKTLPRPARRPGHPRRLPRHVDRSRATRAHLVDRQTTAASRVSRDRGRTAAFVANLPLGQFYHVAVDRQSPTTSTAACRTTAPGAARAPSGQAGGIRNRDWAVVGGGDGFETLPDPPIRISATPCRRAASLQRWNLRTGEMRTSSPRRPRRA